MLLFRASAGEAGFAGRGSEGISYDPNHVDNDSAVNLHITFPSKKEMNEAFVQYHANIGEQFSIPGMYTIIGVEPDLAPTKTEGVDDEDQLPIT